MPIIDEFINHYNREYEHYIGVAQLSDLKCETFLSQSGIRGIVSSRAKRQERLRQKLLARNIKKKYKSFDDIYEDIVDLAGTRIAVYFPGDIKKVQVFIESEFETIRTKEFPRYSLSKPPVPTTYKKRFSGYSAVHYHVKLRKDKLSPENCRYADTLIEIQIATVLMHAWAEVEHDLIYKPNTGEISEDELAILDELNGLVLSGEIALERLQNAVKSRISEDGKKFHNQYELAAYLYKSIWNSFPQLKQEPVMGRVDMLLHFLRMVKLDTPEKLRTLISVSSIEPQKSPISAQIIDQILSEKSEYYCIYADAQKKMLTRKPLVSCDIEQNFYRSDGAIEFFISQWIKFESIFRNIFRKLVEPDGPKEFIYPTSENLKKMEIFNIDVIFELESIKNLRNDLVHGISTPASDTLYQAGKVLERITIDMQRKSK